jgi:hypothetical protein
MRMRMRLMRIPRSFLSAGGWGRMLYAGEQYLDDGVAEFFVAAGSVASA